MGISIKPPTEDIWDPRDRWLRLGRGKAYLLKLLDASLTQKEFFRLGGLYSSARVWEVRLHPEYIHVYSELTDRDEVLYRRFWRSPLSKDHEALIPRESVFLRRLEAYLAATH